MNQQQLSYLDAMGIQVWQLRNKPTEEVETLEESLTAHDDNNQTDTNSSWQNLQQQVANCTNCDLHKSRTQTVFGTGNSNADLLIIGEAPGEHEDIQGKPFVGRAGMLLTEMLKAIKLPREEVFIANILKCRPPQNRDPLPEEINQCTTYLEKQIEIIKPKVICAVGRVAARYLLNNDLSLGQLRKQQHEFCGTPLIVTYHPAYLLRTPSAKKQAYQDLLRLNQLLTG